MEPFIPKVGDRAKHQGTGISGTVIGIFQDRSLVWSARIERVVGDGRIRVDWFPFGELEPA